MDMKRLLKGVEQFKNAPGITITEVFYPNDPRAKKDSCRRAIAKEIVWLLNRGVFEIVDERNLPKNGSIYANGTSIGGHRYP